MRCFILCFILLLNPMFADPLFFSENYEPEEKLISATFVERKMISENTLEVVFSLDDALGFQYVSGQFFKSYIQPEGQKNYYRRSYSIASTPEEVKASGNINVAISLVEGGVGSEWFQTIIPGTKMYFRAPTGKLLLSKYEPAKRIVLLGTGTGIAPYRSMLPELIDDKTVPVEILSGFRNKQEEIYATEFRQANRQSHIRYRVSYSQQEVEGSLKGHIQTHLESLNLNPKYDRVYVCGNPNMLKDIAERLKALGFQQDVTYITENYAYSGHNDAPFVIK